MGFLLVVFVTLAAMELFFSCMKNFVCSQIFLILETLSTLIAFGCCVNFDVLFQMMPFAETFITMAARV